MEGPKIIKEQEHIHQSFTMRHTFSMSGRPFIYLSCFRNESAAAAAEKVQGLSVRSWVVSLT